MNQNSPDLTENFIFRFWIRINKSQAKVNFDGLTFLTVYCLFLFGQIPQLLDNLYLWLAHP